MFDGSGNEFQSIPRDKQCVGIFTTSLCDSDAAQNFRYCIIDLEKKPVIACIVGTDGIENLFSSSMERTHAYYRGFLRYAYENGVQALEEYLADALRELSANGSEDDITVSGIIDVDRAKLLLKDCEEKNRRAARMNDLLEKEDGIGMALSKWEELKKKSDRMKAMHEEKKPQSDALAQILKRGVPPEFQQRGAEPDCNSRECESRLPMGWSGRGQRPIFPACTHLAAWVGFLRKKYGVVKFKILSIKKHTGF